MRKDADSTSRSNKRAIQAGGAIGPLVISFSGLDGAGKSTQIENLHAALQSAGLAVRRLAFWDDVVVGARYREGFVHKVYKSERGVGAPGKPVNRRDKNMRGWHLSLFRHFLYLLDAIHLRRVIARERNAARRILTQNEAPQRASANLGPYAWISEKNAVDVILLDRYIYDELVNLNLENPLSRAFIRLVGRFTPRPDAAYLLDAEPTAARARKPEYSVEFMAQCRESYLTLAGLLGTITVIPAASLPETRLAVLKVAEQSLTETGRRATLVSGSMSIA
jgi:thymidylate kinase